jgi:hypothetical protein
MIPTRIAVPKRFAGLTETVTLNYEANELPENATPDWEYYPGEWDPEGEDPEPSPNTTEIIDGKLHTVAGENNNILYTVGIEDMFSDDCFMEFKIKLVSGTFILDWLPKTGALGIGLQIAFSTTGIDFGGLHIDFDTASDYHVYKYSWKRTSALAGILTLCIDNACYGQAVSKPNMTYYDADSIYWNLGSSENYCDYFKAGNVETGLHVEVPIHTGNPTR